MPAVITAQTLKRLVEFSDSVNCGEIRFCKERKKNNLTLPLEIIASYSLCCSNRGWTGSGVIKLTFTQSQT